MSLLIRGNKKLIERYRERAKKDGLEIALYSEDKIGIDEVELSPEKSSQQNQPGLISNEIKELSDQYKIPRRTAQILVLLKECGPLRPGLIAEALSISPSRVSVYSRSLEREKLIEKEVISKKETYYRSKI